MHKILKQSLFLVMLFFFSNIETVNAQDSDFGNWLIYIGNKKLNNKWKLNISF